MPSLQALEKFKSSFRNFGNELRVLTEMELPDDDLSLPDHEAAASGQDQEASSDFTASTEQEDLNLTNTDTTDFEPTESSEPFSEPFGKTNEGTDLFANLGDLLGGIDKIPDDFQPEEPDFEAESDAEQVFEPQEETALPEETILPEEAASGEEDFSLPPDLLDGFADEIESGQDADSGEDFELPGDEFPAEETSASEIAPEDTELEADTFAELDTGTETPPDFTIPDDIPDFEDSGTQEEEFQSTDTENQDFENLDLGELPDFGSDESLDLPGEEAFAETEFDAGFEDSGIADGAFATELPGDEDNLDLGGETQDLEAEATLEEVPGDSFDSFSPDSDALTGEFGSTGDGFGDLDEFSFPGLDSVFDEPGSRKKRAAKSGKNQQAGEAEEISLANEELEQFLKTLSSYPLNLRIACEELIAEKAVAPEQMSRLIKLLVSDAPAGEVASLAGKILDRTITISKGFEKKTGEELEAEQSSFAYIFVHSFLPVLRLFLMIAMVLFSVGYLSWRYIYRPLRAEKIYKLGIERIEAGEYGRANERFLEAFKIHEKKPWFYTYARAFRDVRQYTLAEEKYQQLLYFTASKNKRHIPEKAAVLEYADMETNFIGDYETAENIIRRNILDYFPWDKEGLLALGDNSLAWGEYERERLEDARESYAKLIEKYGRSDPLLERMLKYFIRTDDLEQVLPLQSYFMASEKKKISAAVLAEMGGYFLDKRFEKVRGVPNQYLDYIGGIREILIRAMQQDPMLPESYYHLARYYNFFENLDSEQRTLEVAVRVFDTAKEESPKRIGFHINSLRRYSEILSTRKEFFPAEENLIKGVNLYQDALSRRLLTQSPEFGRLYTDLGDLEYFVKEGDMQSALEYYRLGEQNGWAPPEIQYRMGAAHYQMRQWGPALDRLFTAYREMTPNRRILYALGNVSYMRGNYFAAQGYYDRLIEILDDDRSRLPPIMPTDDEKELDLAERLMIVQNNLGVTLEALTERTGNNRFRSRAQGLYSDSERAWDVLTRNPSSMMRMRPSPDISAPGINPAYLNVQNSLHPVPGYEPQFFLRIDKDSLEPSTWEGLTTSGYRLSEGIHTGR
jgi:tetratricopeptide (TPR) repeat protein